MVEIRRMPLEKLHDISSNTSEDEFSLKRVKLDVSGRKLIRLSVRLKSAWFNFFNVYFSTHGQLGQFMAVFNLAPPGV